MKGKIVMYKAKDIAELLGVSPATVSLVINNKPGVGSDKRKEIIQKMRELGCDYMLKNIPSDKGSIGFVVYKKSGQIIGESPFFTYILEGINNSINKMGYKQNFLYLNQEMTLEMQAAQLESSGCEGFIIFGVEMQREDLQVFIDTGRPFSVLDNSFQENDVDSVAINNQQGTKKAIQYLYDMGHRNIGYIRCRVRINSFEERFEEYKKLLKELGIIIQEENIMNVGYSELEIRKDVKEYLERRKELGDIPTAFFAENDFLACNAMQVIQEMGYKVPDDISLIGFDDRPIAQIVQPKMTTINVPKDIFGPAAVDLLMSRIKEGRKQSIKLEIGTNLVVRDSVKKITA